jgi:mannose-6-phosphate isomerase-like protein (cupin superfamily)
MSNYRRYAFGGYTGYLVDPRFTDPAHNLVAIRHSAGVEPWLDKHVHVHHESEEYYLLLNGQLDLLIDGKNRTLRSMEMLMVRPSFAHGVTGGLGPIEHFIFRAPAADDREILDLIPGSSTGGDSLDNPELSEEWGFRTSIAKRHNQNCWLIGNGSARFMAKHLSFAYIDFPTSEAANAGAGTRHRLHLHRRSWEYYAVLEGMMELVVGADTISIEAGDLLEVSPGAKHVMAGRQAPYRGFSLRVPVIDDKEII